MLKYTNTNAQTHIYKSLYTNLNEEILAPISFDDDIRWLRLYHRVTLRLYHITVLLNSTTVIVPILC